MEVFDEYLAGIENQQHRDRTKEVLDWVINHFHELLPKIAWNQPMFTHHGTFIIGFSVSKHHLAVSPERAGIVHFSEKILEAGFEHSKELIRFKWDTPVDFDLLEKIIKFNMEDKADCAAFWRK